MFLFLIVAGRAARLELLWCGHLHCFDSVDPLCIFRLQLRVRLHTWRIWSSAMIDVLVVSGVAAQNYERSKAGRVAVKEIMAFV